MAWSEDNFRLLFEKWGHFSPILNGEGYYATPRFLIETSQISNIDDKGEVKIKDTLFPYTIKECEYRAMDSFNEEEGTREKESLRGMDNNPRHNLTREEKWTPDASADVQNDKDSQQKDEHVQNSISTPRGVQNFDYQECRTPLNMEENVNSDKEHRSQMDSEIEHEVASPSNSLLNPMTPPAELQPSEEKSTDHRNGDWKWDPRDSSTTGYSGISNTISQTSSLIIDSVGEDLANNHPQPTVLNDLENLKIRSNRGRPRKKCYNKENKHFKVPTKRKLRKKSIASNNIANETHGLKTEQRPVLDEATAILETGLQMGLFTEKDRESSINLIKKNLKICWD